MVAHKSSFRPYKNIYRDICRNSINLGFIAKVEKMKNELIQFLSEFKMFNEAEIAELANLMIVKSVKLLLIMCFIH